jgi:hypothetical protein
MNRARAARARLGLAVWSSLLSLPPTRSMPAGSAPLVRVFKDPSLAPDRETSRRALGR